MFLIIMFMSTGCSTTSISSKEIDIEIKKSDYVDHLEHLATDFLNSPGVEERRLSGSDKKYLEGIYRRIVINNELILKKEIQPRFHIIKSKIPFYFSVPSGRFFLSDTLIRKYLKSENLFISLLAADIYRVHNDLYEKKILVPLGYVSTKRMLSLYQIPLNIKVEVLKWSYFILKRSGYDPFSVLSWIQTQNKNSLDFSAQIGTAQSQTKEESVFKSFLASEINENQSSGESQEKNSSRGFYKLQRSLL